jgi:hypothetical protein
MNDNYDRINRTIARWMGYRIRPENMREDDDYGNPDGNGRLLPEYCYDLNEMHVAEKNMDAIQWQTYCIILRRFYTQFPNKAFGEIHADSLHRAEALVAVIERKET